MKFKTTAKALRNNYSNIISCGYGEAQRLLSHRSPIAYTCGVYGWNFDVYDVSDIILGTIICRGYRGMPAGIKYDYKLLREAEQAAASGDREALLRQFVMEVVK